MPKMRLRPGLRGGPAGGAHSAPQRSLAGFVGPLRGGDGKWEGRKGKGREERWRGEDGRGGEGPLRLHLPGSLFTPVRPCLEPPLQSLIGSFKPRGKNRLMAIFMASIT